MNYESYMMIRNHFEKELKELDLVYITKNGIPVGTKVKYGNIQGRIESARIINGVIYHKVKTDLSGFIDLAKKDDLIVVGD